MNKNSKILTEIFLAASIAFFLAGAAGSPPPACASRPEAPAVLAAAGSAPGLAAVPPKPRASYFNEGFEAYKSGNFDRAVDLLKMAIVDNPRNYNAYLYLSQCYLEKRMYSEAEAIINAASSLNVQRESAEQPRIAPPGAEAAPTPQELKKIRATAAADYRESLKLAAEGKWDDAVALLENAVRLAPGNVSYLTRLGDVLFDMGLRDRSADCYEKAAAIEPTNVKILNRLAKMRYESDDLDRSGELYSELYNITGEKLYLDRMNECRARKKKTIYKDKFVVLKKRDKTVFVDMGYDDGLKMGDQLKKRLIVFRQQTNPEIKDPRTSKLLGYEQPVIVGEALVTRIEDTYCEATLTAEQGRGASIGDEVKWKE